MGVGERGTNRVTAGRCVDEEPRAARLFRLERNEDVSGQTGLGVVAQGVVFPSGKVALCWEAPPHAVAVYGRIEDVERVHGHSGRTLVVFQDPDRDRTFEP
jgi:hypothetical protein